MSIDNKRRSFLQGATVGGVAIAAPLTSTAAFSSLADTLQRAEFPVPDFAGRLGESVKIQNSAGVSIKATIREVSDLLYSTDAKHRPTYLCANAKVVRFELDDASQFVNDTYQVSHANLGKLDLLLAPVPDADGVVGLEAIFN